MERYRNSGGDSGVVAYDASPTSISVQFGDGHVYDYTHDRTGRDNVERMKQLAAAGHGLNSFINTHVKFRYASKR